MSGKFCSKSIAMLTNFNGTGVGIGFGVGCGFGIGWGFGGMPLHTMGLGAGGGCGVGFGLGWGFGNAFGCHYRTAEVKFQGIDFGKEGESGGGQIPDSAKQSQTTQAA